MHMAFSVIRYGNKVDYVLIDTYSTVNFWYAVFIGRLSQVFNIPYIPILRGGNLPDRLKKSPYSSQKLFNNSFCNVAPSSYLMKIFENHQFHNLEYIPNTIQIGNYPFKFRSDIKPKLLWVRAFASIYNPMMAIKTLEILLKDYPESELCMVGPNKDGSLESCKSYSEIKNLPVTFTGKLDKKEWIALSENYDIFLNTTHYDNTPISVIEAMALGLPVISTSVGGIPYLLEDKVDALLVADNSVSEMAEAIIYLLNNSDSVEAIAKNARSKVEEFDWERVQAHWENLLM